MLWLTSMIFTTSIYKSVNCQEIGPDMQDLTTKIKIVKNNTKVSNQSKYQHLKIFLYVSYEFGWTSRPSYLYFLPTLLIHFLFLKVIVRKQRTEALLLVKPEDKAR